MKAIVKSLLLGAFGTVAFGAAAMAADIIESPIYEPIPEVVPVEIGSGWYLRGDVSYDFESDLDAGYRTYYETAPAVFDAFGTKISPATYAYGDESYDGFQIDAGVDFGVGAGYQFNDFFRGDLTAHYWSHDVDGRDTSPLNCDTSVFPLGSTCRSQDKTEMTAWELMANAYVDLGNFVGFTPYVGGGLGAVHVKYDTLTNTAYCVQGGVDCGVAYGGPVEHEGMKSWRFAYALMAGASYDLTRSLKLDVGYRYLNVDEGDMFDFDSSSAGLGASGAQGFDKGFDRHTVQAGLRYSLF